MVESIRPAAADPERGVERRALLARAFRLEWLTIGWMAIEAIVATASGVAAHSLSLVAFGIDSVIELISAFVLLWRLRVELPRGGGFSQGAGPAGHPDGGGA